MFGIWEWLASVLLGGWFVLSVLNQFQAASQGRLSVLLRSHLIPRWTFFAPNPGSSDLSLEYRDLYRDGSCSTWSAVELGQDRTLWGAIWNPRRREFKLLFDVTLTLRQFAEFLENRETICLTMPYLVVMNYLNSIPIDERTEFRQFRIVETYGFYPLREELVLVRSAGLRMERAA